MKNFSANSKRNAKKRDFRSSRFFIAAIISIVISGIYSQVKADTAPTTYSAYSGTDAKTIPPAPALGPANSVFTDPTFGSRILRVTDANTNGESLIPTDSGFHRAFNADSTAIKLSGPHGDGYWLEFNPSTFKVGDGSSKPALHSLPFSATWEWSTVDPNVIYFLHGNKIAKYNKSTAATTDLGGPSNGDAVTYFPVVIGQDNWVCAAAGSGIQDSFHEIFCIQPNNPSTSKFIDVQAKTINGVVQNSPNWPTAASGQVIGVHDISGGTGPSWLEVTFHQQNWGGNGGAVLDLSKNTWSLVTNGDNYWSGHVSMGNGRYANSSGNQNGNDSRGILLRDPANLMSSSSYQFVYQPGAPSNGWCDGDHLSWLNSMSNPNAPILISRYMSNASNCAVAWTGEIDLAATDGSNTVWRFAHNHDGGCYYGEGFAEISNDGRWALFSSYWDGTLGADSSFGCSTRIDTFIVDLTGGSGSTVSSTPTPPTPPTSTSSSSTSTTTTPSSTASSSTSGTSTTVDGTPTTPTSTTSATGGSGRIEDTDTSIAYTGSWFKNSNGTFSGGTATEAMDAGARATLTFSGTGVNFIGYQDQWSGIANIYVDGNQVAQVDTYTGAVNAQAQQYSVTGLSAGTHTLAVAVSGTKNVNSAGYWVWVDAFDVTSAPASTTTPVTVVTSTSSAPTTTSTSPPAPPAAPSPAPAPVTVVSVPAPAPSPAPAPTPTPNPAPVTASAPITAPAGGGETLTTSGGNSMQIGSAAMVAPAGQAVPSGLAIFGYRTNGVLVSEAGVPATAPALRGRIYASVDGAVNTGIAVANPSNSQATVSFFFTDNNGTDFGNGSFTIPAHGQIAHFLNEAPFNAPQSTSGTFSFSSDVPVSAVAIRGLTNERSEFLVTTLPVANPDAKLSGSVFFPHFADGGGWTTQFVLVNPSDQIISGTVKFYGQGTAGSQAPGLSLDIDGNMTSQIAYSIPPRSSQRFSTMNDSAQTTVGTAQVTPNLYSAAPVGVAIFSFHNAGMTISEAGTPSMGVGSAFRMYAEADKTNLIVTAIAVENVGPSNTSVNFDLTALDGTPTGLSGQLVIPSNGQRAMFLNQIPGFESLPVPFKGVLRVSTANPTITVLGVRSRWNERGDFIFTTTPATRENAAAPSQLMFPHIVNGGGYSTQFIMFSGTPGQPTAGNLQMFSQAGGNLNVNLQ